MVFYWSLSESKSPQISRTPLSIQVVVSMVSVLPLISSLPNLFSRYLGTVPKVSCTTGFTLTFMFHNFFSSLPRSRYLQGFFFYFLFTLWSTGMEKSIRWQVLFFLLVKIRSGFLVWIRWSVCISKSQSMLYLSFSRTDSSLCNYHLSVWSNFSLLLNSQ